MQSITFNLKGHDLFIDAIKAYAIMWVLIGHFFPGTKYLLYPIWGGYEVPLFIIVQCFHFFKKDEPSLRIGRIFTRVILPFIYIQLFIVVILFIGKGFSGLGEILSYFPQHGGYGQGDYYPFVYVQIALLLPVFYWVTNKIGDKKWTLFFLYLILCEGLELFSSFLHIPNSVYRYLAFRYLFLVYFGWLWVKEGIKLDTNTLLLSLLSLLSIVFFAYIRKPCEPWFLDTVWAYHRWPCYFFVAELLVYILNKVWLWLSKYKSVVGAVSFLSIHTYDIFLAQMVAYVIFPHELFGFMPGIMASMARFISATVFSLLFGWLIHIFLSKLHYSK